jgi:hypothetical protein
MDLILGYNMGYNYGPYTRLVENGPYDGVSYSPRIM